MKRNLVSFFVLVFTAHVVGFVILAYYWKPLLKFAATTITNAATHEFFRGTVRLKDMQMNSDLRFRINGLNADLQTANGPLPIEVDLIYSQNSLTDLLYGAPLHVQFSGARVTGSNYPGMQGDAFLHASQDKPFTLTAEVEGIGLEDLIIFNPDSLKGSSGKMIGSISLSAHEKNRSTLSLKLDVDKPGGTLQARFFDLLLPYLPQLKDDKRLRGLAAQNEILRYDNAHIVMEWMKPTEIKVFLHILIKQYNIDLNLNLTIRMDRESSFIELGELLGFIEVKAS